MNIRIPEDLSVIGFDNIPEARYRNLTTIDQHIDQLGYVGTKVLVDMIHGKTLPDEIRHIETKLVVRGTTCTLGTGGAF